MLNFFGPCTGYIPTILGKLYSLTKRPSTNLVIPLRNIQNQFTLSKKKKMCRGKRGGIKLNGSTGQLSLLFVATKFIFWTVDIVHCFEIGIEKSITRPKSQEMYTLASGN